MDSHWPSWQTGPCPSWCVQQHQEEDFPDDRKHQSQIVAVPAVWLDQSTLDEPADELVAGHLHLVVWQRIGTAETMVSLADEGYNGCFEVSFESANRLHHKLGELLDHIAGA